jgi:hypothetical protein
MHHRQLFISLLILLIIGLHALPVLQKLQGERQTFWPFMAWGMYKNSRAPGPIQTEIRRVIAITAKGERATVTTRLSGLSSYAFERMYLKPMLIGDSFAADRLAGRLNLQRQDPFVELRLESETYKITDSGIFKEDNPPMTYQVSPYELR